MKSAIRIGVYSRLQHSAISIGFITLFLFLLAPPVRAQSPGWWNQAWRYRMKAVAAKGGAAPVAEAQFPIPEGCAPGGADVRVVDERGRLCKSHVVYWQPALYGIVAFERNEAGPCWIYLANPKAPPPSGADAAWRPQAGVYLETCRGTGESAGNLRQFRDLAARSTYSFGAGYRDRIFDGFNPFGDPDHYLSQYEAYFNVARAGEYLFATVSAGASFILVDGRTVCQWPGPHDIGGGDRAQHNGKIKLAPGVHRLDYLHADSGGEQHCAEAAWMPPGLKAPLPMDALDFVPIARCDVEALEERGQSLAVDFRGGQSTYLIKPGYTCTAWQFVNCSVSAGSAITECRWEFSDGTQYLGGMLNKIFFAAGDYRVTLTVKDQAGHTARAARAFRVHAIDSLKVPDDVMTRPYFVDAALRMPPGKLTESSALGLARLLEDAGRTAEAAAAYQDLIERQWQGDKKVDPAAAEALVRMDVEQLRQPAAAEAMLRTQLGRAGAAGPVRARLLFQLGLLQLGPLGQPGPAAATLRAARLQTDSGAAPELRRDVLLALGDACRASAAEGEALAAYQAAEALTDKGGRKTYDRSSFALATEAYLRTGQLDEAAAELKKWTDLYPTERIAGYACILEARLMVKRRDLAGAAVYLERFLKCKPLGVFNQMALEDLGDLYGGLGRLAEARDTYQNMLGQFQDEAVQARIKKKMSELGQEKVK